MACVARSAWAAGARSFATHFGGGVVFLVCEAGSVPRQLPGAGLPLLTLLGKLLLCSNRQMIFTF
jgi:hypothetical protein